LHKKRATKYLRLKGQNKFTATKFAAEIGFAGNQINCVGKSGQNQAHSCMHAKIDVIAYKCIPLDCA
jgi:hypothetical protein